MLAICWLTLACGLVGLDDPASLVARLGSDRFAERVEATRALEALGPAARPALEAGQGSADPKVRDRAAALLAGLATRDEADRLFGATPIALDYRDRPLGAVVRDLNARHDLRLALQFGPLSEGRGGWGGRMAPAPDEQARRAAILERPITVATPAPVPFWGAIDRLCAAGGLRHDLHPLSSFEAAGGRLLLYEGLEGAAPTSDSGAFRVAIAALHATWERDFTGVAAADRPARPTGGPPPTDRQLDLRLVVVPEPGRVVRQAGPIRFAEATDDRGGELAPIDQAPAAVRATFSAGNLGRPTASGFAQVAALRLPERPGRSIRRLRGSIPVVVVGRAPDPIVIRLAGAAGKSARNDDVALTVRKVRTDPEQGVTVEVDVATIAPTGTNPRWPFAGVEPGDYHPDRVLDHLKLVGADGRELAVDVGKAGVGNRIPPPSVLQVALVPIPIRDLDPVNEPNAIPGAGPARRPLPMELRFYSFVRREAEIPFDFRDIPLP